MAGQVEHLAGEAPLVIVPCHELYEVVVDSQATNLATNVSALVVFIINGKVIFAVGLVAGLFSIAGNWLGSRFFKKGGVRAVKPIMITVLVIFFAKVLYEVIGA